MRQALLLALLLTTACGAQIRPGQAGLMYRALSQPALQKGVLTAFGANNAIDNTVAITRIDEAASRVVNARRRTLGVRPPRGRLGCRPPA